MSILVMFVAMLWVVLVAAAMPPEPLKRLL